MIYKIKYIDIGMGCIYYVYVINGYLFGKKVWYFYVKLFFYVYLEVDRY